MEQAVSDAIGGRCSCVDLVPVGCLAAHVGIIQRWRERWCTCGYAPSPAITLGLEAIHAAEQLAHKLPGISYDEKIAAMKANSVSGRI